MSITVNTNMQALKIQNNLSNATTKMNAAMERMSSGYKINKAADDAAGFAVSTNLETTISCSKTAANNVAIGENLLDTASGTLDVILQNLQRIRDLAEQAANGTYSSTDIAAISAEADARSAEINGLAGSTTFNGISLLNGSAGTASITLQVGTTSSDTLKLASSLFTSATVSNLQLITGGIGGSPATYATIAAAFASPTTANLFLADCDRAISAVTNKATQIGAYQNRLAAASDGLTVAQNNLTSALSTIKDADVAAESAHYVQQQILQSASSTLLVQANSAPQIALTLIKGQ